MTQHPKEAEVLDALNVPHNIHNLVALFLQHLEIVAVHLGGELPFHAANRFLHIVGDGLREIPDRRPGIFSISRSMAAISSSLFSMENRAPLFLGFQIDAVFGVEKPGGIGPIVRPSHLAGHVRDFRKRGQKDARPICHPGALAGAGAGRQRSPHPERAFVEVRQKLRTDHPTLPQINCGGQASQRHPDGHSPVVDGPSHTTPVTRRQEGYDRVRPFAGALTKQETRQHGRQDH